MPEVRLQNVRAPGREAGGAIGEVISPHAAESLVETELGHLVGDVSKRPSQASRVRA
jgi:hypothetical protein